MLVLCVVGTVAAVAPTRTPAREPCGEHCGWRAPSCYRDLRANPFVALQDGGNEWGLFVAAAAARTLAEAC